MAVEISDRFHGGCLPLHFQLCKPARESSRFHLRGTGAGSTARRMKTFATILGLSALFLAGCEQKKEATITETREATTRDKAPKLFATSDERFRDAKPSPVKDTAPAAWLALPASQFRLLNYRFGESGMGEVWVSLSAGSVLDNANRWLGQFAADKLDPAGLEKLPTATLAGAPGKWVTASGEYASGMGAPPKPGFALAGLIASVNSQILTVKMVGPKAEVEATRPILETYAASLRMAE